jgi:hypothetical protein
MKSNTNKIIAGVIAAAGIYLIYRYFQKKDAQSKPVTSPVAVTPAVRTISTPTTISTTSSLSSSIYPLKKGSKGKSVVNLQNLILKIDKNLLPKFGADGDFGSETEAAVQKLLNKKSVDNQKDFDAINLIYNQKTFPYITPKPTTSPLPFSPLGLGN